ncbi:hypothetical protein ESCO_001405 [Escovopsis weberi]|uniref:DUF2264 domain-containing protein n=1 Tax=Escovopsis weberi TaxID=150374 RepID=A0A0M9VTA3_ESCWE|nr:hypothetical protein ESCO_001405 [Escovopsis weberi]
MPAPETGDPRFNPLHGNPFKTRDDVASAVISLFNPLIPAFSEGNARVQIDASTSTWDRGACDLEGYARPLFGIAPLVAGGGRFDHWERYREGLKNGTDPAHPEYWGAVPSMDQRHVEAAALAYGILLARDDYWTPLDDAAKKNVGAWLLQSRNGEHGSNNHKFFRILVDLALESVGVEVDRAGTDAYLDDMESLYVADGWYRDGEDEGDTRRIDYYNPFAMHYYGLFYAVHRPADRARGARFKERAREFAAAFLHWFADSGSNVPYGRSLSYRQCVASYWGYLAVAGVEALPWGVIKGVYLRNLRWWATQPVSRRDGILTLGYAYPNALMAERYLAGGSPYWAMKAFSPLCLPADHPFWAAEELPMPERQPIAAFPVPGLVFAHTPGHTVMLNSGPESNKAMRFVPEKYLKFAYSSRYGFSVESDSRGFDVGAFDSMIAFSDDGVHYRVREHCETAKMAGNMIYSRWNPWADVSVETWLIPSGEDWHVRVHRIRSPRQLTTIEGGFAAPRADFNSDEQHEKKGAAWCLSTAGDFSGILDASEAEPREGRVCKPHGNTSVMFPRTLVPQLRGTVEAHVPRVFACAVLAGPDGKTVQGRWSKPPAIPSVADLELIFESQGSEIEIVKHYSRGS